MTLDHIATYRAGESGYYTPRARGTVDVWDDSKRYVYRRPASVREFKRSLWVAFSFEGLRFIYVRGTYPSYTIGTV